MLTVTPRGRLKTISRRAGKRGARATRPPSLVSALCARHALQCLQVGIVRSWLRSLAMHFDWLVYSLGRADGRRRSANQHTTLGRDTLAERSKAVAQGAIPKGRGFEPHRCHFSNARISSEGVIAFHIFMHPHALCVHAGLCASRRASKQAQIKAPPKWNSL